MNMDSSARMLWVDYFRGLAVVVMIWVHLANTLLTPDLRETEWFGRLNFYHGLVAPAFFWIAGFVRGVRVLPEGGKRPGSGAVKRLLGVLCLGYLMHFPWGNLIQGKFDEMAWRSMAKVDVLQTLAFSGLVMVGVERFVVGRRMQQWVIGALLVMFVMSERWAADWRTGWLFLDAWLSRQTGSVFCLFPWVGFGLAGWLCGTWSKGKGGGVWIYAGAGASLAWGTKWLSWMGQGDAFFLQRLGWVILMALVVAGLCYHRRESEGKLAGLFLLAGRESLVMYVLHLALIHAIPSPAGTLERALGNTQSVGQTVAWFVLISALSWGAAWWNARRKTW